MEVKTKADLISIIHDLINKEYDFKKKVSQKVIAAVIDTFFDVLKENVAHGAHIELRGFGTFETKIRKPKKALNPRTKEIVDVKRHAVPIFRPGRELKNFVREYFEKNNPAE
jgi:nucleoid DNA-binding protein